MLSGPVGISDLDNAATTPHASDAGVIQLPVELLGGLAHQDETLSI